MKRKIFWSNFIFALLSALIMGGVVLLLQYRLDEKQVYASLSSECASIQAGLLHAVDEGEYLKSLPAGQRITLIAPGGSVQYDNRSDTAAMESHSDRPEVVQALASGVGQSERYSETQLMKNLYYAKRLPDGRVLRLSVSIESVLGMLSALALPACLILLLIAAVSLGVSRRISHRIVAPLNALNLDAPLENNVYDEIAPLLTRMERQRREIDGQVALLTSRQREFNAVTEHMREGLLLLDARDRVLTVNGSAAALFSVNREDCAGKYLLSICRSAELSGALDAVKQKGAAEADLLKNGRAYHVLANGVTGENGERAGTVLLLLDITEQQAAERSRREFTANVSHELKTPLTSISGYSELLRDGLVKPEDACRFAGKIYDEANRLIALIEDIIRLSQLDEHARLPEKEPVELLHICQSVLERLGPVAEKAGIQLTLSGEPAPVSGIPKLLDEMVFNLADNAVKYNREGGGVSLRVGVENGRAFLSVSDTGIGIPQEDQARVFERFYRVDKSRSKAIGGTGLGLSIVKHGAEIHGARLSLSSVPGEGTTVRLDF